MICHSTTEGHVASVCGVPQGSGGFALGSILWGRPWGTIPGGSRTASFLVTTPADGQAGCRHSPTPTPSLRETPLGGSAPSRTLPSLLLLPGTVTEAAA